MTIYLIQCFLKTFLNNIKEYHEKKRVFYILIIVVFLIFEFFIFYMGYLTFYYIITYIPGGIAFAPKLLNITLLTVFFVLIVMSFITSIPTLYKSDEIKYLLTLPISYLDIYRYAFFKVFFYSCWGIVIILLPIFLAFGLALKQYWTYYILIFFILFGITYLTTFIGIFVFLILSKYLPLIKTKIGISVILISIITLLIYYFPSFINIFLISKETGETFFESYLLNYNYDNNWLVYNWFFKLLIFYVNNNTLGQIAIILLIISNFIVFYQIMIWYASRYYFLGINNFDNFYLFPKSKKIKLNSIFNSNIYGNLLKKDIIINLKDPVQWSQILIFFFLILIYIVIIRGMNIGRLENSTLAAIVAYANFGSIGFLISSIALRLVFPNISLEGKSFRLLNTFPISKFLIYFIKLVFFLIFFLIIGILISRIYTQILNITPIMAYLNILILIPIIIFVVCCYFVLGSIFPNFEENNPSKIATSIPGLVGVFLTNTTTIIIIFIYKNSIKFYFQQMLECINLGLQFFNNRLIFTYLIFIILVSISLIIGYNYFKKIEI